MDQVKKQFRSNCLLNAQGVRCVCYRYFAGASVSNRKLNYNTEISEYQRWSLAQFHLAARAAVHNFFQEAAVIPKYTDQATRRLYRYTKCSMPSLISRPDCWKHCPGKEQTIIWFSRAGLDVNLGWYRVTLPPKQAFPPRKNRFQV